MKKPVKNMTKKKTSQAADHLKESPAQKIATGIDGFEILSEGGLPVGRTTYLVGSAGSGKTIFSAEFLYRGITEFGLPGVFVTFEERPAAIVRNVRNLGWDLRKLMDAKKLAFVDGSPDTTPTEILGKFDLAGLMIHDRIPDQTGQRQTRCHGFDRRALLPV